ncbi:MAG: aconitase family protein, partial [Caldilineaceae bacterium]|nr:aconitase family protein [Caldilineaceae bacterium]
MGKTLFDKVWDRHVVSSETGEPTVIYVDAHLIHEVTSPQAFAELRSRGLRVRRPERTFATMDHAIPTREIPLWPDDAQAQVGALRDNCDQFGITLWDIKGDVQGIVHVVAPEMGVTQPGMTIVCGDSHTSTHGAFGALAFGIGTSEVAHVLAAQCLMQEKPKTFAINVEGRLAPGVTAKDIILAIIAKNGASGGVGHVFEYRGSTIRSLGMANRMTICNMSIEGGARAGMIAPDITTYEYMYGRPYAPTGKAWNDAVIEWSALATDDDAVFDRSLDIDAGSLEPMVTYGTNPGMGVPVTGSVPQGTDLEDDQQRRDLEAALDYMGLVQGQPMQGQHVDI